MIMMKFDDLELVIRVKELLMYKNYNWFFMGQFIGLHVLSVYGVWLIPTAKWQTLVFGKIIK